MSTDAHIRHAIEIGERNAETIELISNHCANARVELGHGWSMVEGMTGLPISARRVECDHAATPSGESSNLEWVASDFYRDNCVGCPHRQLRGVPNLATLVERLDAEQAEARRRAEAAEAEREVERQGRRSQRAAAMQGEPLQTRELIRLVDSVDASEPDEGAAEHLLLSIRGAPEIVTPRAAETLLAAARESGNGCLLEAVEFLVSREKVTADDAVAAAVDVLAARAVEPAAVKLLLEFRDRVTREHVRRLRRLIVAHAGAPTREERIVSGFRRSPAEGIWDELLRVAYGIDAATILQMLSEMLDDAEDHMRLRAAGAACVILAVEPATAPILAAELIEALRRPDAVTELHWDEASGNKIQAALAVAIEQAPDELAELAERSAPRLDEARRDVLFGAFDRAARNHLRNSIPAEVATTILKVALRRLQGDWGAEIAFKASDTVKLLTRYHVEHLGGHVGAIAGALLDLTRSPEPSYHPLLDLSPTPNPLAAMEAASERMRHGALVRNVRDALGALAPIHPEAVLEQIGVFLEAPEGEAGQAPEVMEMRRQAVRLLGALGKRHEVLPLVIPHLYTALVGTDVGARGEAISAWREIEIAHRSTQLPLELYALLPRLLADPYVFVHQTAVREIARGLVVSDQVYDDVLNSAIQLARYYAEQGDSEVLDDALTIVTRLARRYEPRPRLALMAFALRQARKLNVYKLRDFLERHRRELRDFSEFPLAVLDVLRAPEVVHDPNHRDNLLLRELRDLRPHLIAACAGEIRETALVWLPDAIGPALDFVEVLQRASCWSEALALSREIYDSLPDTTAERFRRAYSQWVLVAAQIEEAVASSQAPDAMLLDEWEQAEASLTQAREEHRRNWNFP